MLRFFIFGLACLAIPFSATAGEKEEQQIKAELVRAFPELKAATVKPSPVSGMYEVEFDSKIFYTTSDGKYLFMGDVMDLRAQSNITETRRAAIRKRLLDEVGEQNMLVIGPDQPKRTLTVFTDVDCAYCAKFHLDVPTLNKQGVKVRYLFFPRAGIGSESYKRAVAVWCASDRAKAIGIERIHVEQDPLGVDETTEPDAVVEARPAAHLPGGAHDARGHHVGEERHRGPRLTAFAHAGPDRTAVGDVAHLRDLEPARRPVGVVPLAHRSPCLGLVG